MASDAPRLYIALYTDADIHGKLAAELRDKGFDAISSREVRNDDLDDPSQLAYAVSQQRTLLTHNTQDFEPLHRQYMAEEISHFGIIVSNQISIGELLRRTLNMLDALDADQVKNTFHHLSEFK
jgi:predicted nuclease of predicted toxin-antitoxin system